MGPKLSQIGSTARLNYDSHSTLSQISLPSWRPAEAPKWPSFLPTSSSSAPRPAHSPTATDKDDRRRRTATFARLMMMMLMGVLCAVAVVVVVVAITSPWPLSWWPPLAANQAGRLAWQATRSLCECLEIWRKLDHCKVSLVFARLPGCLPCCQSPVSTQLQATVVLLVAQSGRPAPPAPPEHHY